MLNRQKKVIQYELLFNTEEEFSDAIELTMLQNTVSPADYLKHVKDISQQLKVSLDQDLNHDGYEKLLNSYHPRL